MKLLLVEQDESLQKSLLLNEDLYTDWIYAG